MWVDLWVARLDTSLLQIGQGRFFLFLVFRAAEVCGTSIVGSNTWVALGEFGESEGCVKFRRAVVGNDAVLRVDDLDIGSDVVLLDEGEEDPLVILAPDDV